MFRNPLKQFQVELVRDAERDKTCRIQSLAFCGVYKIAECLLRWREHAAGRFGVNAASDTNKRQFSE